MAQQDKTIALAGLMEVRAVLDELDAAVASLPGGACGPDLWGQVSALRDQAGTLLGYVEYLGLR